MRSALPALGAAAAIALGAAAAAAGNDFKPMAKEFSRGARRAGVERVAVLPFAPSDQSAPEEGWSISERLVTQLVRIGRVKMIERGMLDKLLEEHNLAKTGVLDATTLKRLGKILSVDAVVTGSFESLADAVRINARLIEVETGVILAASELCLPLEFGGPGAEPQNAEFLGFRPIPPRGPALKLAPEERLGLRDSPSDTGCEGAAARADAALSATLDIAARHWALQLKSGVSFADLEEPPGSAISDADLRWKLYDGIKEQYARPGIERPSTEELGRMRAAEQSARRLRRDCGL